MSSGFGSVYIYLIISSIYIDRYIYQYLYIDIYIYIYIYIIYACLTPMSTIYVNVGTVSVLI